MVDVNRSKLDLENFRVDGKLVLYGKVTFEKPNCEVYTTNVIFKSETGPHYCVVPTEDFKAFAIYSPDELYDSYDCKYQGV